MRSTSATAWSIAIAATNASPACHVQIHFLYQVLRGFPPQQVFAQTLLGFEVASADPDVVGINFVMPEDGHVSMRDYHLQMQMLDYLHSVYPKVHISLHAGELAPGMVPPAGLQLPYSRGYRTWPCGAHRAWRRCALRRPSASICCTRWPREHIMVEVNLTSNDGILGRHRRRPSAARVHRRACALFALDRRRGRLAHRPDA